ncbi:sensor histidine kinase [Azoarcus indigens]|uniref:histidine kinase n=1 Tax=Azoarcus indigens TaxID=29545 RepID=A0A4R6DQT2_9RHOO|nr:ATP-binding protein [Azoarcus indigens]TDN47380.1 C4-dicarboxylate-specific signal transduction histidine kinase [Azoarcus indigens]
MAGEPLEGAPAGLAPSPSLARLWLVRRRLATLLLPWMLVFGFGTPLVWYDLRQTLHTPLLRAQADALTEGNQVLVRSLAILKRDIQFLGDFFTHLPGTGLADGPLQLQLFHSFAESSGYYDQVRWIDETGMERIRINYRAQHSELVPRAELQNKADRPYFVDTMQLNSGSIYYSPLDLNIEHGAIEQPLRPTLRVATPVFDKSRKRGIVILNYHAGRLLERLMAIGLQQGLEIQLINQDSYWLLHPDAQMNWGWQLDRPKDSLAQHYPQLWRQMQENDRGSYRDEHGIWSYLAFNPSADTTPGAGLRSNPLTWRLLVRIPEPALDAVAARSKLTFTLLVLMAVAITVGLSARLALAMRAEEEKSLALAQTNTALQHSLDNLRAVQEDLARADKLSSLGLMVAGVAHELNTPLGSAMMALSTARQELQQLEERIQSGLKKSDLTAFLANCGEGMELAARAVDRAGSLVRRFKQTAIDRTTMERRSFVLAETLVDADHRLHKWDHSLPVSLALELDPAIEMDSYPGPLGQVVSNLIENALVHGFPDNRAGNLTIRAEPEGEDGVLLTVADTGVGIPAEVLTQIFDPFFTTRRHDGGTGLGLHVVYQIVTELLGGRIEVSSVSNGNTGSGTVFTLHLPRVAPAATPRQPAA